MKKITVLYFAKLGEDLGTSGETIELAEGADLKQLKNLLYSRGNFWQIINQSHINCAVNQCIEKGNCPLYDKDEVAFFPPVTGG